ncbi:hypothetical protein BsWGS_28638 [Bradybaena similaris]
MHRTSLLEAIIASFNSRPNDNSLPLIQCANLTDSYNPLARTYRKAVKTFSRYYVKHGAHQNLSISNWTIGKHLIISSSIVKLKTVNCLEIIKDSQDEIQRVQNETSRAGMPICDSMYSTLTADCELFKAFRGYITSPLTEEELLFPLAYSLNVYRDAEMVERLLRAIYRPQNYYCIHVDGKASSQFLRAISDIAKCFRNIVIASRRIDVEWGTFSVLQPDLFCMEELWKYPRWKYFLTLTGQEFPLKTNYELVKILKALKGANDVLTTVKYAKRRRWKGTVPPSGVVPAKGSVHITVNRDFVDYILHNDTAKAILEWTQQTDIPDEAFYATLGANSHLGIRGTYTGEPEKSLGHPFLSRYKNWGSEPCAGRFVREICILTTGDLPQLFEAKEMFANKFFLQEDRVVVGCLEEKIFNNTRDEFLGTKRFNTSYYDNLDIVLNQVT